jgi:hypothetical protein
MNFSPRKGREVRKGFLERGVHAASPFVGNCGETISEGVWQATLKRPEGRASLAFFASFASFA